MPGLDEVLHYLTGVWHLVSKRQEGFGWLDLSWRGLVRSFWAFAWALPALAVIWASWRLYYLGRMPEGTSAGADFIFKMFLIDAIGWVLPLILVALVARPLGFAQHLATLIIASNWIAVPFAYATAIPFAIALVVPAFAAFSGLLLYAVFGASIVLQYRLLWMCVGKQNLLAATLTALFVLPPLLAGQGLQVLLGTLPN